MSAICIFNSLNFSKNRETLDMALGLSSFLPVEVCFLNDSIKLLDIEHLPKPELSRYKNFLKTLKMLELYDISSIYVVADDLKKYKININSMLLNVIVVSKLEIMDIISNKKFKIVI